MRSLIWLAYEENCHSLVVLVFWMVILLLLSGHLGGPDHKKLVILTYLTTKYTVQTCEKYYMMTCFDDAPTFDGELYIPCEHLARSMNSGDSSEDLSKSMNSFKGP